MPIGTAAAITGIATVGTSVIGASAASKAANAQKKAADKASATQMQMYEQTRSDLAPYREGGGEGMSSMLDLFGMRNPRNPDGSAPFAEKAWGAYQATPYYQNPLKAYIKGADMSAAARGHLLSSGHFKRVGELASDYATRQFGSYMDRLTQLAGIGSGAAAQTGNAALSTGKGVATTQLGAGEAQASGIVGSANAISNGLTGTASNLATYLSSRPTSGYPTFSAA